MYKDIVLPNHNHCILNTITSILKYYNVNSEHKSLESLDKVLEKKYRNIVFIILDGLGMHNLKHIDSDGYLSNNIIDCVTSVYPSTTTAAITTYYSGKSPYETGFIAWSQYFKEYGREVDMLSQKESYFKYDFSDASIDVFKEILNYESVFEMIEKNNIDVKAYEIMPTYAVKRSKRSLRADNTDELMEDIELICGTKGNNFMIAYTDNSDGLFHQFGTDSVEAKEFVLDIQSKIKNLREKLGEDTLLLISADHGHKNIDKTYSLLDYPEILECLYMPINFESRCVNFYVKDNMKKEFEERFNNVFANDFYLITKEEFLDRKFLGDGKKHPKIDDFLGNYLALSTGSSIIQIDNYFFKGKGKKKSTHCGLSKEEMEVPLIVL